MKKLFGILFVLMITTNCSAMTFSQPVEVGNIWGTPQGGFGIKGADYNNGTSYQNGKFDKMWSEKLYEKGLAIFGDEETGLYVYYDFSKYHTNYGKSFGENYQEGAKNGLKFGGKNKSFNYNHQIYETACRIQKIESDKNLILYMLIYQGQDGGSSYTLLGRKSDGTWMKYFDTEDLTAKYLGIPKNEYGVTSRTRFFSYENYFCNGDTIIIKYKNKTTKGEFRFKWDDAAQWFGIEKVTY